MKPKIVLFDVGDVLLDWQASSEALANKIGVPRDLLLDTLFVYADDMFVGKITTIDGWTKILSDLKIAGDPWEMVLEWRSTRYWFIETLEIMRDLHAAGYSIGIMTNSWLGLTVEQYKSLLPEELKLVDFIFDSSIAKLAKPDNRFYELVEKQTKLHGAEILLVDDSAKNKLPADQLGWQFFHYITADGNVTASARSLRKKLLV